MGTRIFIHIRIWCKTRWLLHSLCGYPIMTSLHYMENLTSLLHSVSWYDKEGRDHPFILDSMVYVVLPCVHGLCTSLNISNSRTFLMLIYYVDISTLPKISSLKYSILHHEAWWVAKYITTLFLLHHGLIFMHSKVSVL